METVALKVIFKGTKSERQESLKLGSSDINVLRAKKILNSVGYSLVESNQFDTDMQTVIKDFQKKSGLKVDGIIGKNTAVKLNQVAKSKVTILLPVKPSMAIGKPSLGSTTKSVIIPIIPTDIPEQTEIVQEIGFNWKPLAIVAIAIAVFLMVGGRK